VNPASEAHVERELAQTPEAQQVLHQLAIRRATYGFALAAVLGLFLLWLPESSRRSLIFSLFANRLLITLLLLFGLMAVSLLWSRGQRVDVWLFQTLNLRGYHALWVDRAMWVATFIGNEGFVAALVVASYLLGDHGFAFTLGLGALTLLLLVTIIKACTDRARPFNLLRETRVIGLRERGLSFPSGHTAQTFFWVTLVVSHFHLPLGAAVALYGIAVLVAFTRVYLGMHYPRDVIAGAILAVIWGTTGVLVAPYL
jgi:membrane-associated phospholipid phosphatase